MKHALSSDAYTKIAALLAMVLLTGYAAPSELPIVDESSLRQVGHIMAAAAISPDGSAVVYGLSPKIAIGAVGFARYEMKDLATNATVSLPGRVFIVAAQDPVARPAWSPDSRKLAYTTFRDGDWRLNIWDRSRGQLIHADVETVCGRPPDEREDVCATQSLRWSPDSQRLYFLARPKIEALNQASSRSFGLLGKEPDRAGVTVLSTTDSTLETRSEQAPAPARILALNTVTGLVSEIGSIPGAQSTLLSPNGLTILVASVSPAQIAERDRTPEQRTFDYTFVDVQSGEFITVLPNVRAAPERAAWAPNGSKVAFVESGPETDGDVLICTITSRVLKNVTADSKLGGEPPELETAPESRTVTYPGTKFGSTDGLSWTSDGSQLIVSRDVRSNEGARRAQLWAISVAERRSRLLSANLPCSFIARTYSEVRAGHFMVAAQCDDGSTRIFQFSSSDAQVTQLGEIQGDMTRFMQRLASVSRRGDIAFVHQRATGSEELFVFAARAGHILRVAKTETQDPAYTEGASVVLRWRSRDGREHGGSLYLPSQSVDLKRRPPLIVQVYPLDVHLIRSRRDAAGSAVTELLPPLPDLVRKGYAVLKPDLAVAGGGNTCLRLAEDVDTAVGYIRANTHVDINRLGIIGHSFGGWAVNCLLTRLDYLDAAVSVAGLSNWLAAVFSPTTYATITGGQLRVGQSVWQAPTLFWQESPLSALQDVRTPLLLVHGRQDRAVGIEQSLYMFMGLRMLGKEANLVAYEGADHASVLTHPDFGSRVTEWFDRYLK